MFSKTKKAIMIAAVFLLILVMSTAVLAACGTDNTEPSDDIPGIDEPADDENPDPGETDQVYEYDIVVYGDTAAAVSAAVSASRLNAEVALVAPGSHLGGMLSGGLSRTDLGNSGVIGGMAREFYKRNAVKKGKSDGSVDWYAEPHIAEIILREMIAETQEGDYGIDLFENERLKEENGVTKNDASVTEIICESNKIFRADQFIDATYEGDLMAQAGVSYTVGRESQDTYKESLAGVVSPGTAGANNHNFTIDVSAYDENEKLYPEISSEPIAEAGSGDEKVQAYNFRLCVTKNKENQVPFPKPENYDPDRFALLAEYVNAWTEEKGAPPTADDLFLIRAIEGTDKYDMNNKGAFSTDYIGGSYGYPDGTYAEREEIWQDHYDYTAGLLYFLTHDESIPEATRQSVGEWGLCEDEFTDTNNWPFQLYVREGRRMIGEYVMTQKDIAKNSGNRTKTDSIGMGSYNSDSHNVQRYVDSDGNVKNEGNMEVPVAAYEIPYRMLLPKEAEANNLLVACTFSASHVAYSSIRMEPQYMIIGQAAGIAMALAVRDNSLPHDIDVKELQSILIENGGILSKKETQNQNAEFDIYDNNVLVYDTFSDYQNGWSITTSNKASTAITQNDDYVNIAKTRSVAHSFLTRKNVTMPDGAFAYAFRTKLNAADDGGDSVAEFTIRAYDYQVIVVLTYDADNTAGGTVRDAYGNEAVKTSTIDTSEWHDYFVKVNDDHSYSLYADGTLMWEGAAAKEGGTDMIKIGSDNSGNEPGSGKANFDVEYFMLTDDAGEKVNAVGGMFVDEAGNKLTNMNDVSGKVSYTAVIVNPSADSENVKLILTLNKDGEVSSTKESDTIAVSPNGVVEITAFVEGISADGNYTIRAEVYAGEDASSPVTDGSIELVHK